MADARSAITQAYQTYLGRAPEAGQLDWRVGQLGSRSLAQQISDIQGSAEARSYAGRGAAPAGGGGGPTELQSFAERMAREQQDLLNRQKGEQEGLFNQYEQARAGQETLPGMYSRLKGELGIPGLQQTFGQVQGEIFKVKDMLDRLDENVTSRSLGTMTTEAQRQRAIAAEGDPMRNNLGRLATGLEPVAQALSGAQGELSNMMTLGSEQQERELEPLKMRINSLSDRFAREMTGFSEGKQTTLDALVDKVERERFLSDRDWELAQSLAKEERDFAKQKELTRMQLVSQVPKPAAAASDSSAPSWSSWSGLGSNASGLSIQSLLGGSTNGLELLQGGSNGLTLQGSGNLLQGSSGLNLQGGTINLQGGR